LYEAAWYAWNGGNLADAEKMALKMMKTTKKIFGQEQEETMSGASTYRNQGWRKEAEELGKRCLA
jgi:hypothetical protein